MNKLLMPIYLLIFYLVVLKLLVKLPMKKSMANTQMMKNYQTIFMMK